MENLAFKVFGFRVGDYVQVPGQSEAKGRITQIFDRPDKPEAYGNRLAAKIEPIDEREGRYWADLKNLEFAVLFQLAVEANRGG